MGDVNGHKENEKPVNGATPTAENTQTSPAHTADKQGKADAKDVRVDVQSDADSEIAVAKATEIVSHVATLGSKYNWLNWTWGILVTICVPGAGAALWWGVIPVGSPTGSVGDKALFVFLVHPCSAAFLSMLLCILFLAAVDEKNPWRPLGVFFPTMAAVYVTQVLFPGLITLLHQPFELNALAALAMTFVVTMWGIHRTPCAWVGHSTKEALDVAHKVFLKISIVVVIYTAVLALYTFVVAEVDDSTEGFITVVLAILNFIFKKTLLAFTDPIGMDSAMLIAGFWLENLTDMFITLAFPTAESFGPTFAIIFFTRVIENMAYLGFQLDVWFKFRVWIKGKFKKDQKAAIEEDLEEYADDRGHSGFHPGYRRRQLKFLVFKLFSQISSYVYFLFMCPVMRYGPNKNRFPYKSADSDDRLDVGLFEDARLDHDRHFLSTKNFSAAMVFCVFQIIAVLTGGAFIWWWMHKYFPDIIISVRRRFNEIVVKPAHYGLILAAMVSNAFIATSFVQVYYRVFFL